MSDVMSDFARLLEDHIPRLRRYARALTRNATRADDLVQGCLVRALAKQHLWQPGTDMRAWLFTILHNQHVNDTRCALREGAWTALGDTRSIPTVAPNALALLQLRDLERALERQDALTSKQLHREEEHRREGERRQVRRSHRRSGRQRGGGAAR